MDINSRALLEVYSDMSFAAAAKRLGTSEKYLRDKVMNAEKNSGRKIFTDLTGQLELTAEGKEYIDWLNYVKSFQLRTVDPLGPTPDLYKMDEKW